VTDDDEQTDRLNSRKRKEKKRAQMKEEKM